ncbi:L-rhamnose-binding lectin SML-like isoform X3 [Takifugu rubripes]|uniref:L-rhamnose-binding lectin SML-like n=1 Tax=Takifugu rubripes TaxID=31033 RepID=A0A674MWS7_TAKRU|nr:L-rhamnose-binding lectin SML-like isoform X1 [Takifugu rubripes]XP_029689131.1 L-rhamnose-binding lectin SML-like isoform X3 [Takifugu rubripes]
MQHFTASTILLLAATCSLMTTAAAVERVTTCESPFNVHHLRCEKGVISVQAALYGRADTDTCSEGRPVGQLTNTACSQPGTEDLVKTRCDGKKECEINIRDVATPDPCVGTFKYLDTNYTCLPAIHVVACEGSLAHLFCAEGQVISVYGADYGRRDETTCSYRRPSSQTRNTLCSGPTNKVAELCNGKNRCTFRVGSSLFGDPCRNTYKYLELAYVCEYPVIVPYEHYSPE